MKNKRKIKYSLVFNRTGRVNKDGKALVQIRAYQNARSRYFSTGIYVDPDFWDDSNKRIKHTHPCQFEYNRIIRNQLESIELYELNMIQRLGSFSIDRLDGYEMIENVPDVKSFTSYMYKEIYEDPSLKPLTKKTYELAYNRLVKFRDPVYFEDLCPGFITRFDRHLHKCGLHPNTIKKQHKVISSFVNRAIKLGLYTTGDNPYKKFRFKGKEPERVFLSEEELRKIENLTFSDEYSFLAKVKDIFLLSCYTGLRFGDIIKLYKENFESTEKGFSLNLTAEKTGKRLVLPLHMLFRDSQNGLSKPERIVRKYLSMVQKDIEKFERLPLFKISNQYYNRALKRLVDHAGIRKDVTSHVARRTFATIMAKKVQMPILQKLLQHSSPDMTNIYIQLSNRAVEDELKTVNW